MNRYQRNNWSRAGGRTASHFYSQTLSCVMYTGYVCTGILL